MYLFQPKKCFTFKASFENCTSITVTALDFLSTVTLKDKKDASKLTERAKVSSKYLDLRLGPLGFMYLAHTFLLK